MRFAIIGLIVVAFAWFFIVLPAQRDVVRNENYACIEASVTAHHFQGDEYQSYTEYADSCARAGNPNVGI